MHVGGQFTLGGVLQVVLINGFALAAGQSFDLFDWSSLAGTFSAIQLPSLASGLVWNTSQLYTSGTLSINLPGDYNGNGIVDAADYTVWRDSLGSTTKLAADGDANGIVDASDYFVWTSNFGKSAGSGVGSGSVSSAGVPEPQTVYFLAIGLLFLAAVRRRGNKC